ncbi:conserved Plasmodium protein, unknown function [Plasmodium chabaudi adami]|uniref:Uncharacterized protein n=1 Tax=Plasmodium chabaudi adami TaxID=5826 RepID=A0A1D3S4V2_PLACE|nr:conserved Plasmodium protein, unknown function [Plasmodium chabaudi adami]
MNILLYFCVNFIFVISIYCMPPFKKGNENFPSTASMEDTLSVDSSYPSFNIHYNFEPKDWKNIELIENENNHFLNEINNEIKMMEASKKKIYYVLNVQKQQFEELLFLVNRIKYLKNNNKHEKYSINMPQYLRTGNFNSNNNINPNKVMEIFNQIDDYMFNTSPIMGQDSFYHNLAEQWINLK